jgi:Holliday junction resolvase RusA-like endonuclease
MPNSSSNKKPAKRASRSGKSKERSGKTTNRSGKSKKTKRKATKSKRKGSKGKRASRGGSKLISVERKGEDRVFGLTDEQYAAIYMNKKSTLRVLKDGTLKFTFYGRQYTKKNHKSISRYGVYIPDHIKAYEYRIKDDAAALMEDAGLKILDGLVIMKITYYMADKKGDVQNLPETTFDALEDAVYVNDKQVHDYQVKRRIDRKNPRVIISVTPTEDPDYEKS